MKWAVELISPMQVVWYRVCFAFIPILLFALFKRQIKISHFKHWYHYLAMSLLANIIIFYFFAKATSVIDSGIAGAISGTIPLFTIILSLFFLKEEKMTTYKCIGVLIGLVGVLIITTPWQANSFKDNITGIGYMTIGSLF
jgi:drug/metabolite transporter (DMT)-like permease